MLNGLTAPFKIHSYSGNKVKISIGYITSPTTGMLIAKVNGTEVAYLNITAYPVAISGSSTMYAGGSSTFHLPYIAGAMYNWLNGDDDIQLVSASDSYGSTYYATGYSGTSYMSGITCAVTYNGVTTYFGKQVTIY